jgi:hypothetical protein
MTAILVMILKLCPRRYVSRHWFTNRVGQLTLLSLHVDGSATKFSFVITSHSVPDALFYVLVTRDYWGAVPVGVGYL